MPFAVTRTKLGTTAVVLATVLATALAVGLSTLAATSVDGFGAGRAASRMTSTWSASKVTLGTPVTVRGRVTSKRLERRTVSLYVSLTSGWRRVARTTSGPKGRFRMKVPTDFYLSRPMQLRASPSSRARSVVSASRRFTVVPAFAPVAPASAWAPARRDAEQRWNPCRAVTYRVNADAATPGAVEDVQAAFDRAHEATGINFRYLGDTDAFPKNVRSFPPDANIVVAWGTPADSGGSLAADAMSGSSVLDVQAAHDAQGPVSRIRRAGIMLNTADNAWMDEHADSQMRQRVLVHEVGIVLGLGPVTARGQRMNEDVYPQDVVSWGAGDLTGLRRVGLLEGCVADDR